MKPNPIREELNRHRWQTGDLDQVTLVVRHRGAPGDEAQIRGSEIVSILPDGIQMQGAPDGEEGSFIPFHRILRITMESE